METIAAEARKLAGLPSTLVAIGITLVSSLGITVLNASQIRARLASGDTGSTVHANLVDTYFEGPSFGVIGIIVLGVAVVSSEYTGRQIVTSLVCVPRRGRLLAAKAFVLAVVSGFLGAVLVPVTMVVARAILGHYARLPIDGRVVAGTVVYWIFTALIVFAVTVCTRHGAIPLIIFIANTSVISIDLPIARILSIGRFLPDIAGSQLFAVNYPLPHMLPPVWGGIVMGLWAVVLLGVAALVFVRRDA